MKAILFSQYFEAPDELVEFCKSIGYTGSRHSYSHNFSLMFDERVVQFCEQRLSNLWNEKVYKGAESHKFRCGFAGAGYIREINTTKKWRLRYNNVDEPIVDYVNIRVNDYGYTTMVSERH